MATFECANCLRTLAPYLRYEDSGWCEDCVERELLDQALEEEAPVHRQVFG